MPKWLKFSTLMISVFVVAMVALAVWHYAAPSVARAHDWYAPQCCNGSDCKPVPASEVEELDWSHVRDLVTGQVLTGDKIKTSQDGRWHVCNRGGVRTNETLCIYRPAPAY
jgi:hypothetical protein